jgi:hypothetical protein
MEVEYRLEAVEKALAKHDRPKLPFSGRHFGPLRPFDVSLGKRQLLRALPLGDANRQDISWANPAGRSTILAASNSANCVFPSAKLGNVPTQSTSPDRPHPTGSDAAVAQGRGFLSHLRASTS